MPPPTGDPDAPLKALIFDSWYDAYRGVVVLIRVIDGTLRPGMKIRFMINEQDYEVEAARRLRRPSRWPIDELGAGEVGFLVANIKNVTDAKIGDTVTEAARRTATPFPGFQEMKPMVFAGLYPIGEPRSTPSCATRSRSCAERRGLRLRARDVARRSASASAAASSACCTWRSSRSGSSASTTWT